MSSFKGKNVLVVGAAKSGVAAVRLLVALGAHVTLSDEKMIFQLPEAEATLKDYNINWEMGPSHNKKIYQDAELIVISPGVSIDHDGLALARKKNIPIIGEIELAAINSNLPILAVTGSNGKTSVTDLTGHILKKCGFVPFVGGNIGEPYCNAVADSLGSQKSQSNYELAVLELSSFQLETVANFHAHGAAFLNLTPDHLDRHGDMAEYFRMKNRIFINQNKDDTAVVNDDDLLLSKKITKARRFGFSRINRPEFGACIIKKGNDDIIIVVKGKKIEAEIPWKQFKLWGTHNQENVMASVGLSMAVGVNPLKALEAACDFKVKDHRIQLVGEFNGVSYYNDSKATNVGAVISALNNFQCPVVLIAGGRGKGLDFRLMKDIVNQRVKYLILMGESRHSLKKALGEGLPSSMVCDMNEAVRKARRVAKSGEAVLLSPACASFDMYKSYKERGDIFAQEVKSQHGFYDQAE